LNTEDAMCRSRWRKQIGMIDDHDECSGWMFLLVPAHPGCRGQIPQSRKTVVCVCVCVCVHKIDLQHCICSKVDFFTSKVTFCISLDEICSVKITTPCLEKRCHYTFTSNLTKWWAIFKIISHFTDRLSSKFIVKWWLNAHTVHMCHYITLWNNKILMSENHDSLKHVITR